MISAEQYIVTVQRTCLDPNWGTDNYFFCCYLQYFVGVMAILLGSGAPKVNFYCYLHYFNIRSTDAIYFLLQWLY